LADIVLIRHGSTAWNEQERFRGLAEIELSETGKQQAMATAKSVARLPVSGIYASPVGRALETARIIASPLNLEVKLLPALRDINFGELQGLSFPEAETRYSKIYSQWRRSPHLVKFPGGESLAEVRVRASNAVAEIIQTLTEETVVLVSHRVVIGLLIVNYLGLDDSQFRQIEQNPCAINIFQKQKNHFYAILLNETCHLRDLEQVMRNKGIS
jgi:broad specificity phosphatase PhoE